MAENDGHEGRRYPRNLQGLLRFCTENTKTEDASGATTMEPMSEERKRWLAEALAEMAGNDPVKLMMQDIQILLDANRDIVEYEEALENLQSHCEDIDLANDFHKLGGCHMLSVLFQNNADSMRWRVADLIATLTQNNPTGQRAILEAGLLPQLLQRLNNDRETELVRIKSLYAVSCLVRDCDEAEQEFLRLDGLSYLLRAMQSDIDKLRVKATFTIAALCHERPHIKSTLCDMGMVEQLVGLLLMEHSSFHEYLMRALISLVTENDKALQECNRPEFHLQQLLEQRQTMLSEIISDKPEYQEELEYVKQLYELLGYSNSTTQQNYVNGAER